MTDPHAPTDALRRTCLMSAALVSAALVLAGCASGPAPKGRATVVPSALTPAQVQDIAIHALGLVGTPYRYGGNTPEGGFDCSGLVNYVFRDMLDLRLPRTSRELAAAQGPRIATDRLASGDLVFFGSGGQVSHVGIAHLGIF